MISAQASELNNAPQSRECDNFANWWSSFIMGLLSTPSSCLKNCALISRQWLTDSHACQQTLFVATCSRLEVNPTLYSLTLQDGVSPLYIASGYGHSDVVDILLKAGADVHQATTKVWYTVVLELVSSFVHQPMWQWCSQELWLDLNTEIGIYNKAVKHFC